MNSRDYWAQREAEQLKYNITEEAEYEEEIRRIYQDMLDAVQKEIESFYAKYARAEGITIAEAKKRVSQLDIKAYERKAKRYVKQRNFSKQANEAMRLYNATMKINRLEMLKANIGLELIKGHEELSNFMEGILKGRTEAELNRQAGILGKTVRSNAQKAHAIVNGSFHNGTFSDRIWQYQDLMREDLGTLLQTGLIQGKNPRAIAKDLKKYWYGNDPRTGGGATYCMERLMRTELARVQTEAQKQSFERNGFDMYEFICNHNGNTCSICSGLNGKHFKVEAMMPGENAPPMHPNCRCSTAAWEDDDEYEAWLDYLDKGGTTEEWNKTGRAEWEKLKNTVANSTNGDIIKTAGNSKLDENAQNEGTTERAKALQAVNPNRGKGAQYEQNCQRCAPAYEMRRRGLNVTAKPAKVTEDGALAEDDVLNENFGWFNGIFKGISWQRASAGNDMTDIKAAMATWGDGARAEVYVQWINQTAHIFIAEQDKGKTYFIDPQTGSEDVSSNFNNIIPGRTLFARIDNLEVTDLINECIEQGGAE